MTTDDLITECIDALSCYPRPDDTRRAHIRLIRLAIERREVSTPVAALLGEAARIFEVAEALPYVHRAMRLRQEADIIHGELQQAHFGRDARWAYHGSLVGSLAGISAEGLIPGRSPVWPRGSVRDHSDHGVYFAKSWRRALWWADLASKGGRPARRQPVVLRVPTAVVDLQPDRMATSRDNWVHLGSVPPARIERLCRLDQWTPQWTPVGDFPSTADDPALLAVFPPQRRETLA